MTKWTLSFGIILVGGLSLTSAFAAEQDLHFNGLGFLTQRTKRVSVVAVEAEAVLLKRASDDEIVAEIPLMDPVVDPWTLVQVFNADFTDITEPGIYYLEIPDFAKSRPFPIAENSFDMLFRDAMLGMYGQRSGVDIAIEHGGTSFAHNAGHLQDGYLDYLGEPEVFRDGVGGWYDAGDYGKYVVNGAFTAGMMLAAWEDFETGLQGVVLQIPETGGDLPDFLDEVKVEIDWLLKMQLDDGSVSHKLTSLNFDGFVQPKDATAMRYFTPYSTAAVADFVAITAKAARIFEPYDPDFAATCLAAAEHSFDFLMSHPDNVDMEDNFENGVSPFRTGSYQTLDGDDRIWAAAEFFETTGNLEALELFETRASGSSDFINLDSFDWSNVKNLGSFVYLKSERAERDPALVLSLETMVVQQARNILSNRDANPFGRGIRTYNWGSNGTVLRTCMILQAANRIDPDDAYVDGCVEQIDYVYGRNYYGRSQVTGNGYFPPCNPHDRRSGSDSVRRPYPGLLVGGGSETTNWVDVTGSYETNEVAVNWNGALIYALAGFVSEKNSEDAVEFEPIVDDCTETPPPPPPPYVEPSEVDSETDVEKNTDMDSEITTDDEANQDAGPDASVTDDKFKDVAAVDGTCGCRTAGVAAQGALMNFAVALLF